MMEHLNDNTIKKIVKNIVDEIDVPPAEDLWPEVLKKVRKDRRINQIVRLRPAIAIILMITVSITFFITNMEPVSAFTYKFINSIEEFTNNTFKIQKKTNQYDAFNIDDSRLSDAQKDINFDLMLPSYIPKGFTLTQVNVQNKFEKKEVVSLLFVDQNDPDKQRCFEITEQSFPINTDSTMSMPIENTKVEHIWIDSIEAVLIIYDKDYSKLVWDIKNLSFSIDGEISKKEIVEIAKSMS